MARKTAAELRAWRRKKQPKSVYKRRLRAIVRHIEKHPESWNQADWHCGSSHCVGGHAELRAGYKPRNGFTPSRARKYLGLNEVQAAVLFASDRSLAELRWLADHIYDHGDDGFSRLGCAMRFGVYGRR